MGLQRSLIIGVYDPKCIILETVPDDHDDSTTRRYCPRGQSCGSCDVPSEERYKLKE